MKIIPLVVEIDGKIAQKIKIFFDGLADGLDHTHEPDVGNLNGYKFGSLKGYCVRVVLVPHANRLSLPTSV